MNSLRVNSAVEYTVSHSSIDTIAYLE